MICASTRRQTPGADSSKQPLKGCGTAGKRTLVSNTFPQVVKNSRKARSSVSWFRFPTKTVELFSPGDRLRDLDIDLYLPLGAPGERLLNSRLPAEDLASYCPCTKPVSASLLWGKLPQASACQPFTSSSLIVFAASSSAYNPIRKCPALPLLGHGARREHVARCMQSHCSCGAAARRFNRQP